MNDLLVLVLLVEHSYQEIRLCILELLSCLNCGATFSPSLHVQIKGGPCPKCGAPLVRRKDDTEEALVQRLNVYRELTLPVVSYYEKTAPEQLHRVNAGEGSDAIFGQLSAMVGGNQG